MLVVFSPTFVVDTKTIFRHDFIAPLKFNLSPCETIKVNNKNTRKRCEIGQKLTKNLPEKSRLQELFDSNIHSSPCEESDFRGKDADSDAEL